MTDTPDMSKHDGPPELVRQQSWPAPGPAELDVAVDVGRVRILLEDSAEGSAAADEVRVEVRHDPAAASGWSQGISGFINWLGAGGVVAGGVGPGPVPPAADPTEAVRAAEITWSGPGRRLVVRSAKELPLRTVPLAVTILAPAASRLAVQTGGGDVTVTGRAGWASVRTGSGDIRLEQVDGDADVTTGSGAVDLGPVAGRTKLRTGSGAIRLAAAGGPTEIRSGSGDVVVGEVAADLGVRTGSGEVVVSDASSGRLELTTGSGDVRIGVHSGVVAELDLSSGSGRARSELDVGRVAPAGPAPLVLRGRTGSGDVLVTRA